MGYGFENEFEFADKLSLRFTFIPGFYDRGNDVDLGGWLMFRSGIGLEYEYSDTITLSVTYDHRSSGDIWEYNPGMETLNVGVDRAFKF